MNHTPSSARLLSRLSLATVIAVYLLILVGGIVRSTGSGMGCPDWPKCFSSWVPPTDITQLPSDYKEVYAQQRAEKNERFLTYLEIFGFSELANRVKSDKSILIEADFNAAKTWTEYINRLIGAVIGLLIFATFLASVRHWQTDRSVTLVAFGSFILVGIQGWVGSIVVSTNLLPGMITFHMLLALIIVGLLIYVVFQTRVQLHSIAPFSVKLKAILIGLLVLTLGQILMGTQVRESVDIVAKELGDEQRQHWIDAVGSIFTIHRSLSYIVTAAHFWLAISLYRRFGLKGNLTRWSLVLLIVIGLEIASGAIMAHFGIPRFAQPVHLLLATVAFGIQLFMLMNVVTSQSSKSRSTKGVQEYASY
ncbi:MAG: COX15/CtaA family protein [Bacteroidota bacterium]